MVWAVNRFMQHSSPLAQRNQERLNASKSRTTSWWIRRGTRSHEFEKERRRQREDCLETVIEDLDEQESAFDMLWAAILTQRLVKEEGRINLNRASSKNTMKNEQRHEVALIKLNRWRSKLIVFGFDECVASLRAYHGAVVNFRVDHNAVRDGKKNLEEYTSGRRDLGKSANSFREAVTKAFASL
jgi:hypothetical protein